MKAITLIIIMSSTIIFSQGIATKSLEELKYKIKNNIQIDDELIKVIQDEVARIEKKWADIMQQRVADYEVEAGPGPADNETSVRITIHNETIGSRL